MRRSSRARINQAPPLPPPPPPPPPAHTNSSTSLSSSARGDRSTRSNNKLPSPQESPIQGSDFIDDSEVLGRGELPTARRSKRSNTNENEESKSQAQEAPQDEDVETEEVTRCICGNAEYPGPPPQALDQGHNSSSKLGANEDAGQRLALSSETLVEDIGNFFIQCDSCQVWQHGGCVGLLEQSMSPEEYFCESCKPEYHRVYRNSNGPVTSRYLPVLEASSPEPSLSSSSRDKSKKRDGKGRHGNKGYSTKRRATLNSREAAYDEEEELRRAIEESREIVLGKRGRDESEDIRASSKRRRTSSDSLSPSKVTPSPSQMGSEDEASKTASNGVNGTKRIRGAAARNHRDKELRDRQKELAAQRAEAANKRNARSERRRADDSAPPSPTLSPTKPPGHAGMASHRLNAPDTPSHRGNTSNANRKTGRPPARRGRLGRNQYTRDLPIGLGSETPLRERSRDPTGRSSPMIGLNGHLNGINGESGRNSRPKYHHPNRTSMNEMKRRVAAILEFVSKMQRDKGANGNGNGNGSQNQSHGSSSGPSRSRTPHASAHIAGIGANGHLQPAALLKGVEAGLKAGSASTANPITNANINPIIDSIASTITSAENIAPEREFKDMPSDTMVQSLMSELRDWQGIYGKYGEK